MPKGQPKKITELKPFALCKCGWALFPSDTDLRDNGTSKMWITKGKGKHELVTRVLKCPKCGKLNRKSKRLEEAQQSEWL